MCSGSGCGTVIGGDTRRLSMRCPASRSVAVKDKRTNSEPSLLLTHLPEQAFLPMAQQDSI
jgi:hypothetical protein